VSVREVATASAIRLGQRFERFVEELDPTVTDAVAPVEPRVEHERRMRDPVGRRRRERRVVPDSEVVPVPNQNVGGHTSDTRSVV